MIFVCARYDKMQLFFLLQLSLSLTYEGWNFNSGNYLFTTDT